MHNDTRNTSEVHLCTSYELGGSGPLWCMAGMSPFLSLFSLYLSYLHCQVFEYLIYDIVQRQNSTMEYYRAFWELFNVPIYNQLEAWQIVKAAIWITTIVAVKKWKFRQQNQNWLKNVVRMTYNTLLKGISSGLANCSTRILNFPQEYFLKKFPTVTQIFPRITSTKPDMLKSAHKKEVKKRMTIQL